MVKEYREIIKKYFKDISLVESNLISFNNFMEKGIQKCIEEIEEIVPTIIPKEAENFRVKFGKVTITKPEIVEADGSKRRIFPMEARLRQLTYSASINVEVNAYVNDIQRESFITEIGKIPVMIKSRFCHLQGLKEDDLIKNGEDPSDPGGYFILNGNERVLINVEDLVSNKMFIEENPEGASSKFTAKLFSERGSYRIPHLIEYMKDGILYLSFTRFKRVPIIGIIKALGLVKDQDIMSNISKEKQYDAVYINLVESVDLKTEEDALESLAKRMGVVQPREVRIEKAKEQLDKYLLPHLGITPETRLLKAYNLCKLIKRFLVVVEEGINVEDKDHLMNKRLKLSGDLLMDLFRVNLRNLIQDILYNFQRLVKRGKFQSIKIIIRNELLSNRIKSAMATGIWVGGRKGISQNMDRTNFISMLSHLQRVVSLLDSTQENFEARALHCTHLGRYCPVETPEGTPIGLRKNLALMASITQDEVSDEKLRKSLEEIGLKLI